MKIVYCLPQIYKPGGIERIVSIKANYLADKCGYKVYIITACQKTKKPFYHFSDKIEMIDLNIDYDSTLILPIWKRIRKKMDYSHQHKKALNELLNKIKPDITISTFTHEAAFLPQINDGSKKVLEFHFCKGHKRKMADAFRFPLITRLAYYIRCWQEENIIIPKYDQFVVLTEEDKEQWIKKNHRTICIPNILPFETEVQSELSSKSAIAVGRLDAQKGFDKLIRIWKKVNSVHSDWHLDIYGDGKDKQILLNLIEELNLHEAISIHAPTSDIISSYLSSSLFIMTSRYEGLPMTLLEATSLGLPAICYNFKCGPKDVIIDKQNGFLINENDEKTIVDCINIIINNEKMRKQMGQEAKRLSLRYSKEIVMAQWVSLFNSLTSNK